MYAVDLGTQYSQNELRTTPFKSESVTQTPSRPEVATVTPVRKDRRPRRTNDDDDDDGSEPSDSDSDNESSISVYSTASKAARKAKTKSKSDINLAKLIGAAFAEAQMATQVTPKKKTADPTLTLNIQSDEVYMHGLISLPNNMHGQAQ